MADIGDYPRVLTLAPDVSAAIAAHGGDIPAWLDMGWIFVESAGRVGDADYTGYKKGGELGLFQLNPDERSVTHYTDEARLKSPDDADYQIEAGHALIDYYGSRVAEVGVTADVDPLYWMLIKLAHGMGRGGMQSLVRGYTSANGSPPTTWGDFADYARANPYSDSTADHLDNTERVRSNGVALAGAGAFVPPGSGSIGGYIPIVLLVGGAVYAILGRKA
jgi:hypothetical protein